MIFKWTLLILVSFVILLKLRLWINANFKNQLFNKYSSLFTNYNWAEIGAVTHVKNREFCRSDWAFSVTGALEAQWYFKTGKLISLSEQNLIDCSYDFGNNGCYGGGLSYAYEYILKNNGVNSEEFYPYEGEENFRCYYNKSQTVAIIQGYKIIDIAEDEKDLLQILLTIGPISVGINLQASFWNYTSGIYYEEKCTNHINYAVLLVGYGTLNNEDYWVLKNCMGEYWGEQGYMRIARNRNNHCGIATYGIYPIV